MAAADSLLTPLESCKNGVHSSWHQVVRQRQVSSGQHGHHRLWCGQPPSGAASAASRRPLPRGKRNVVVSRCSRPFVAGCRRVQRLTICGGGLDLAGCTQVAYREWTASGQVSRIGVMIAGNSGRPGGAIYKPWFASPQQRLQGVSPGHRTQEEGIVAAWLVGSERTAPHQLSAKWDQLLRETYANMEFRFVHCLHNKWGMVENDVKAFKGFIDEYRRPINDPSRWPDDVRQRWLATRQGVDYVNTQHEGDYGDAWILPDADLCVDKSDGGTTGWRFFKLDQIVRTTLIFVAGPNACPRQGNHMMGSMLRTQNKRVLDETTSHFTMLRTASGQVLTPFPPAIHPPYCML